MQKNAKAESKEVMTSASDYLDKIRKATKKEEKWHKRGEDVISKYRDERSQNAESSYNILWSNTETLKAAVYSQTPKPDIRQRRKKYDSIARKGADYLEQGISHCMDEYDFDDLVEQILEDYLLPGRGVAIARYKPTFGMVAKRVPVEPILAEDGVTMVLPEGAQQDEMGYFVTQEVEELLYESTYFEYVGWKDIRIIGGRTWKETTMIAVRGYYTRDMLKKDFGEKGARVVMTARDKEAKEEGEFNNEGNKAEVWEVWDKTKKKVVYVSEGYPDDILKEAEDPLKLSGFFPVPRPLIANRTNRTLIPVPLYCIYQDQAIELNTVTKRISKLTAALQAKGVYKAVHKQMQALADAGDNVLLPVDSVGQQEPLENVISYWPIERIAGVLMQLYQARDQIKQVIYEVTGISDIVRGATQANETATAQRIKGQFASIRIRKIQKEVQRFIRDMFRMNAEIIAEQFQPKTLEAITGEPVDPQIIEMMKAQEPRQFRIDVESDSTMEIDADAAKQRSTELVSSLAQFAEVAPVLQGTLGTGFMKELLIQTFRSFKAGRPLEDALEMSVQEAEQKAANPQPPQPTPEQMEAEAKMKLEQQKLELEKYKIDQQLMLEKYKFDQEQLMKRDMQAAEIASALQEEEPYGQGQNGVYATPQPAYG